MSSSGFRKELQDIQYITAMNPTSGNFTVCERLQIQFATFDTAMPDTSDLCTIYGQVLFNLMDLLFSFKWLLFKCK